MNFLVMSGELFYILRGNQSIMKPKLLVKWNTELIIAWLFLTPQINYYMANLLDMFGINTVTSLVYFVAVVLGIISYGKTLKTKRGILFMWALILSVIASALINYQVTEYMFNENIVQSNIILLTFLYFPVFLLLQEKNDFELLMNYLWKGSLITLSFAIGAFLKLISLGSERTFDYMSFAYMMLSPIMICFIEGWRKRRISLIFPIMATFILFVIGCRGAAVALAIFLMFCFLDLYFRGGRKSNHLFMKAIALLSIVLVGVNMNLLLRKIVSTLDYFGFSSRTIEALLFGKGLFIKSDGRQSIWGQSIDNIGLLGKGLYGDRTVLLDEYHNPVYPHNFVLEVMIDCGMILGSILILAFAILITRAVLVSFKSGNLQKIQMTFAMLTVLLVKHMVSASFLTSFDFWFYVGIAMNLIIYRSDYFKLVTQ